ncbi:PP2C family serine/threonine-protein phosphatase [Endozoicomonas numazuensis]|uniref:PPM-type phosphatase domain-containing protein n=1 Tax=Endozoicomonas numazuensis TaxID=1137799 RepID=A0A081NHG2_9GAMM|nr:PP2C family serine/threonine-protein phosphatase [Endozoicomonas numazuensis]KEQ17885.1 hypothetical protein GZ78_09595 [Endozoicomonas numazuensis]
MRWLFSRASVIGPAHVLSGLPNQDSVGIRTCRQYWAASVSDGLGSKPFSDVGSKLAVKVVLNSLHDTIDSNDHHKFVTHLYNEWLKQISPLKATDAAATCLAAFGRGGDCVRLVQLGDGAILYRSRGVTSLFTSSDNKFGNETSALGSSRRFSDWSIIDIEIPEKGDGIILMTDGISEDIEPEDFPEFMQSMYESLRRKSTRARNSWLKRELKAWPTPGHSDDKSIAVVFRN